MIIYNPRYGTKVFPTSNCHECTLYTSVIQCETDNCYHQMCYNCWLKYIDDKKNCPNCNIKVKKPTQTLCDRFDLFCRTHISLFNKILAVMVIAILVTAIYIVIR